MSSKKVTGLVKVTGYDGSTANFSRGKNQNETCGDYRNTRHNPALSPNPSLLEGESTQTVIATEKSSTRIRPQAQRCPQAVEEIVTSHAAECPHCGRETRVGTGAEAVVYGSCRHFAGVVQSIGGVAVEFIEDRAA